MTRSWKTTLAGISGLFAVAVKIITTGQIDWLTDGPAVTTAIGLIAAKDAGVSGTK